MIGQTVSFKNSDAMLHNVRALPRVDGNQEFNFGQPHKNMVDKTTFTRKITQKEVMVKIFCNVHEWMLAHVAVLDNPCFAVTDTNGNFRISNVPPGNYTLVATHLKAGSVTNNISVVAGQDSNQDFTLSVPKAR